MVADILNKHFVNIVRYLADKGGFISHILNVNDAEDPLDNIIKRFQHHASINAIKQIFLVHPLTSNQSQEKSAN